MNEEPRKLLLRRADVLRWTGLTKDEFQKLKATGVVHGSPSAQAGGTSTTGNTSGKLSDR